jgi:hypothetical protein
MRPIVIDFETYFGDDFTLSKMSTEAYIRDPRFECHGAAIKWQADIPARWYDALQLQYILKQEDWSDVFLICHHTAFDALILSHHYNIVPKMYGCTMSMARALHSTHLSVSLDEVRRRLDFPAKRTPYNLFRGKHWNELDKQTQETLAEGCEDEVESIWQIFKILAKDFPVEEFEVCDSVIRMFVNPVLQADTNLLADVWEKESRSKQLRFEQLAISEADVQSADKFQALLEAEGVEIGYKENPKGELIPAFAKNDDFMQELLEDEDDRIRGLAEARIGAKSALLQTRAETLGFMAGRGPLCVYLRYCGAATLRPTGGDGANWLNFKRGSDIRRSILAPDGYLLGPVDASQIECRVPNYLAGQEDVVENFRQGKDPYVNLASEAYGEKIYKPEKDDPRKAEMEAKRGMGKQGELMCGYGAAGRQFKRTAKAGLYGPSVELSDSESNRFVEIYRSTHPAVVDYWKECNRIIARLAGGPPMEWGPFLVKDHKLILPSGQAMNYETLEYCNMTMDEKMFHPNWKERGYWRMKVRRGYKKMWGSKLAQNICEMVSRVIVSQAMIRIKQKYGIRTLNWPYDELLLLIPDDSKAEETLELCRQEMCVTPSWLPGIPLDAEASLGRRYSK